MWEKSPIRYIENVKIPILFIIGKNDRRVPPSQGIKCYNILKARQVPTRLIFYDDGHALTKVDVEADVYIQCMLWIKQYL
ncbi:acylamino-acid-releasing enzyme-like [Centruroides sculpturatus]|nr:acylamino-acid-releasing enzyme-like [Centruroides sculpturatus]